MSALKDRMPCPTCNKEIINKEGKLISTCPHCGAEIPFAFIKWTKKEDLEELSKARKIDELVNKGIAFQGQEKYAEAIQCYDEAIALHPAGGAAWNKGTALFHLEKNVEALICFDKAIALSYDTDVNPWFMKGAALVNLNRFDEALVCYNKAHSIDPKMEELKSLKKYIDARKGSSQGLMPAGLIEDAAKQENNAPALKQKALEFIKLNQFDKALPCFDQALALDAGDADLWSDKGYVLFMLRRREEGLVCVDKAISINPEHQMAWHTKAGLLAFLNKPEEAEAAMKMAESLKQDAKKRERRHKFLGFRW